VVDNNSTTEALSRRPILAKVLIERFNNTLRQRVSRLVRETLSFSKTLANHIGALKYFICHYNLTRRGALPVYSILKFF
jgi:IS1 family transposase